MQWRSTNHRSIGNALNLVRRAPENGRGPSHRRPVLALALGIATVVLLDARAARRQGRERMLAKLAAILRREAVPDATVEGRVLSKLGDVAPDGGISATTEHGCVILTGNVRTAARARIVRTVARVDGVDSVIDLMTERRRPAPAGSDQTRAPSPEPVPSNVWPSAPPPRRARSAGFDELRGRKLDDALRQPPRYELRPGDWSAPLRVVVAGAGAGLAIAAWRIGGAFGLPLALVGSLLCMRGASNLELRAVSALPRRKAAALPRESMTGPRLEPVRVW